jgi:hypothetical protein
VTKQNKPRTVEAASFLFLRQETISTDKTGLPKPMTNDDLIPSFKYNSLDKER